MLRKKLGLVSLTPPENGASIFSGPKQCQHFPQKWVPERCHLEFFTYMYMYPPNNSPPAKTPKSATAMDIVGLRVIKKKVSGFGIRVQGFRFRVEGFMVLCFKFYVLCFMFHILCCMVYGLWFTVYGLWIMDYGLWFMVYGLWFMNDGLWFMVYGLWFMVYGL